jgi:lipopolysaccharide biosynthesis glycosyltransferase
MCSIVFAFDEGFARHFCVAYCSLIENNKDLNFNTYILHSELSDKTKGILEKFAASFQRKIEFIHIDDAIFSGLVTNHHFKKPTYYRLLIPEVIHDDKVLYFDSDIVVSSSIKDLFDIDISNYYLAAVENIGFNRHEELEMRSDAKYFNSGVMLINLKKWIDSDLHKKAIQFAKKYPGAIKFLDQCALNSIVNGAWLSLAPMWNQQSAFFKKNWFDYFSVQEFEHALNHPAIIHYTGSSKPWHYMNDHPYKSLYCHYLEKTPYKNYIPEDFCLKNIIKKHTLKPIRRFIKKVISRQKGVSRSRYISRVIAEKLAKE